MNLARRWGRSAVSGMTFFVAVCTGFAASAPSNAVISRPPLTSSAYWVQRATALDGHKFVWQVTWHYASPFPKADGRYNSLPPNQIVNYQPPAEPAQLLRATLDFTRCQGVTTVVGNFPCTFRHSRGLLPLNIATGPSWMAKLLSPGMDGSTLEDSITLEKSGPNSTPLGNAFSVLSTFATGENPLQLYRARQGTWRASKNGQVLFASKDLLNSLSSPGYESILFNSGRNGNPISFRLLSSTETDNPNETSRVRFYSWETIAGFSQPTHFRVSGPTQEWSDWKLVAVRGVTGPIPLPFPHDAEVYDLRLLGPQMSLAGYSLNGPGEPISYGFSGSFLSDSGLKFMLKSQLKERAEVLREQKLHRALVWGGALFLICGTYLVCIKHKNSRQ